MAREKKACGSCRCWKIREKVHQYTLMGESAVFDVPEIRVKFPDLHRAMPDLEPQKMQICCSALKV